MSAIERLQHACAPCPGAEVTCKGWVMRCRPHHDATNRTSDVAAPLVKTLGYQARADGGLDLNSSSAGQVSIRREEEVVPLSKKESWGEVPDGESSRCGCAGE